MLMRRSFQTTARMTVGNCNIYLVYVISNTDHIIVYVCPAERLIRKAIQ